MFKRISATDAKNNFGGLLDDVASLGRVEIVRHGRLVAIVLSPSQLHGLGAASSAGEDSWRRNHMIPADLARRARIRRDPIESDEDAD